MEKPEIIEIAKRFIFGEINIEGLTDEIDEKLFELRQTPELTNEQAILSNIELLIHEAAEGHRNWDELDELLFALIENDTSEQFVTTITLNSSVSSEFSTVSRAIPVVKYHQDFINV